MKKLILAAVLIFVLSGCSNSAKTTPQEISKVYNRDFSVKVLAAFGENEAEMEVVKNSMSISISMNSPAELEGMGIEIFDEHAKIDYNGMEQNIEKENLPEKTPFLLLEDLFDELSDPDEFTLSTEDGNLLARGENFSAVLSAEDFTMLSAEFPLYNTKFTFSDWDFSAAQ